MTLAAIAPSTGVALAGFALCGIGLANLVPILFSAAGRQGGANPGAAIAAVSLIGYGGMLVAPTLIGVSAEQVGFPAIFSLCLSCSCRSRPCPGSRRNAGRDSRGAVGPAQAHD